MGNYKGKRRSKFNNTRCEFDGLKFDSKKELERWKFLRGCELSGEIYDLKLHPRFPFVFEDGRKVLIKGDKRNTVARFSGDFSYYKALTDEYVVEDVKSPATARDGQFKLRRAIFELIYGVDLRIVYKTKEPV